LLSIGGKESLSDPLNFGVPAASLAPGDHMSVLYSSRQERDVTLAMYMHAGLAARNRCISIVEIADRASLLADVEDGVDVDRCIESGQLELFTAAQSYLRRGSFSVDDLIEFWEARLESAPTAEPFEFTRIAGDLSEQVQLADDFGEFAAYESELNRLAAHYPWTILCLYDRSLSRGDMIIELLKTHPKLLVGGLVIDNPYHLDPEEYLASRPDRRHGWTALTEVERRLAELVAQGLNNAQIGVHLSQDRPTVDREIHRVFRTLEVTSREALARLVRGRKPGGDYP
jgi:DNA-binding CsgD family transcriptional regulator